MCIRDRTWAIVDVLGVLVGVSLVVSWGLLGAFGGFLGALGRIWELVMHSQHAENQMYKNFVNCSETLNNCHVAYTHLTLPKNLSDESPVHHVVFNT